LQKETRHLKDQIAILTESFAEINQSVISDLKEAVNNASAGLSIANQELSASTDSIRKNARAAEQEIKSVQGIIRKANKGK
jgi:formiminotetrahydrofolate cyclodeaminase